MIKCLRVDHRLLHGQVAFSWTSYLSADCILIACDAVVNDEIRKAAIKLAKPQGVKLVIKSIEDAAKLVEGTSCIKSVNLGGTKAKEGTRNISKAVNILPKEEEILKTLSQKGIEVEIRMVPNDEKIDISKVL